MQQQSCTIIGDGAIGLWFARTLVNDFDIRLLLRQTDKPSTTYEFTERNGQQYSHRFDTHTIEQSSAINSIILPLKAYQVEAAFQQIKPSLTENACILLSHNGLGTIDKILPLLSAQQTLLFMTTTEGALKINKTQWKHTGQGQSVIAALSTKNEAANMLIDRLTAKPNIQESENILPMLWRKLAINCAINPLTAIHQITNGKLAAPDFHQTITQVCEEVSVVARHEGICLSFDEIVQSVYQVIKNTHANYSSMNRDIAAKRTTEIEAINGYICQQAQKHNVSVPVNQSLVEQINNLSVQHY